MSLPATLEEERFFALPKVTHQKVLGDDYVHLNNTVETIKIKSVSTTGSIVNYKTTFHLDQQDTKNNIQQLDELKLSFPYKSLHFQAKMDRKGNIKKHVEIGEYKNVFFYTQFKHNFSYQNLWARLGAFYFDKGNQAAVRLERDAAGQPFFSFRNVVQKQNFQFATAGILHLGQFTYKKFDSQASYTHKDYQFTLTHLSNGFNLGQAKLGVSGKLNDKNIVAVQLSQNLAKTSSPQLELGVATQCNKNLSSKFKINDLLKFNLSSKYVVDKFVTLTASAEIDFKKGTNAFDFSKPLFTPIGYQIDLNF